MKKKILGMILTLVVMMIVPLVIGAADPVPYISVTGSIDQNGKIMSEVKSDANGDADVIVAVDGNITLNVMDIPEGGKVSFDKGGDDTVRYTQSGNSIAITGNEVSANSPSRGPVTIKIKVEWEKTGADGKKTPMVKNLTCQVTVIPKAIVSFTVNGTVATLKDGKPYEYPLLMADNIDLYVGDIFTVTSGSVKFNSGETKAGLAAELFDPESTAFTAGQSGVAFTLTIADLNAPKRSEIHTKTQSYDIHVVARETEVKVERNPNYDKFVEVYDAGTQFDFNTIRLAVYYKNTTALQDYAYYNDAQGFKAEKVAMAVDNDEFIVYYDNEPYTFTFSELGITTVAAKTIIPYIKDGGKTTYYYGDKFTFADLELDVVEKGLSGNKTYTVTSKGFTQDAPKGRIDKNTEGITITYDTKSYTWKWSELKTRDGSKFQVLEDNRTLVGIEAVGTPLKNEYTEGQTVKDWSGLTFYAIYEIYNAETEETVQTKKVLSEDEIKNIKALVCEYSKYDPKKNTYVVIEYTEGQTTVRGDVYGFTITGKKVESIKVTTAPTKTAYDNGDKLDLTGMKITLYYTNGTSEVHSYADPNFTCSPAHNDEVSATTKAITVVYKNGDVTKETTWSGITVDSNVKIKSARIERNPDKMVYEVDEAFDPTGIMIIVEYADMDTPTTVYDEDDLRGFTRVFKSVKDNKVDITINNEHNSKDSVKLELEVTVKEKVVPTDIKLVSYKKTYMVGETPDVKEDITDYTLVMSDDSTVTKEELDELVKDKKITITEKFTTTTKITASTKKLTLSVTYKGKTVTEELPITVTIPECVLTTSGGTKVINQPYENFELALEDANDLNTTEAKKITITLSNDVELTEKYQFNAERTIGIDLNGNDITMKENQLIVPHKSTHKNVEIVLLNTSSTESTIKYDKTDKDKWIKLGKNDELVIDWETDIPGIYEIELVAGIGGKITGPTEVAHGNDAKYTITPDTGYEVEQIKVDGKIQGKGTTITIQSVDADHKIEISFKEVVVEWVNPFTDVSKYANYYSAIEFVYENNLFKGVSTTKFEPTETMTRAMFVTVLGRLAGIKENDSRYTGKSSFSDVQSSAATSWYVPYVAWATEQGLLLGYEDGTFRPNNEISHTEMYILMERYARKLLGVSASATGTRVTVSDANDIPTWAGAYEAVQFATKYNYVVATSNRIKPNDDALRHELASLLESFCDSFSLLQADEK